MTTESQTPRSRRALLAAGVAAGAAVVATAIERPLVVQAANGATVTVGGTFSGTTATEISTTGADAIVGISDNNTGALGQSTSGTGLSGVSTSGSGVWGWSFATDRPGLIGQSEGNSTGVLGVSMGVGSVPSAPAKTGVYGHAAQDAASVGVKGDSDIGTGVRGETHGTADQTAAVFGASLNATGYTYGLRGETAGDIGSGVYGFATNAAPIVGGGFTIGVEGNVANASGAGTWGWSWGGGSGAVGVVGATYAPGFAANTGVYGLATDASGATTGVLGQVASTTGTGVRGYAPNGSTAVGVKGESTAGTGVLAVATTGSALRVSGKAKFSRSGRASVLAGHSYVDVTVAGGLASNSVIHATLQTYRSGVAIAAVRANYPSTGKARIYLTKVASSTSLTSVGWLVAEY